MGHVDAEVDPLAHARGGVGVEAAGDLAVAEPEDRDRLRSGGLDHLDITAVRNQLEVNALAPLRLTHALLPNLVRGSKLAFITSRMGSIGDNGSGGFYGYRMSKAALNAAAVSLARDLVPRRIAVIVLHPGFVRTGMTGGVGGIDPADSARDLVTRIGELTLEGTGRFLHANGESLPW